MPFFVVFTVFPLIEVVIFMQVSAYTGLGTALLLSLLTAIIGGLVVRRQGLKVLRDLQDALMSGYIPSNEIFDAICLVAAGGLLVTPGFLSDIVGFALLVPKVREIAREYALRMTFFQIMDVRDHDDQILREASPLEGEYTRTEEDSGDQPLR